MIHLSLFVSVKEKISSWEISLDLLLFLQNSLPDMLWWFMNVLAVLGGTFAEIVCQHLLLKCSFTSWSTAEKTIQMALGQFS